MRKTRTWVLEDSPELEISELPAMFASATLKIGE